MFGEHVLAGYAGGNAGREALELARGIVGLTGGRLTAATVHPPGRPAAAGEARALLDQAAAAFPEAETALQESRGVGRGLSVLASRIGADVIVVASPEGGARGRIAIGSTADNLLHSAPEAVMIAPAGHTPGDGLARITVAYVRRPQCDEAVARAAEAAARYGVPLRLLTLAIGDAPRDALRDDLALAARLAAETAGVEAETELAEGDDVAGAAARAGWPEGELLICASSEDAAAHRVFLGEVALKLLRAVPCPVAVLPRGYF
ncbi:universal stress protein [Actinomadura viridis]|uniref:Nucleotide-binding universal stress UspA family protein n=1 Tax=Actinomadura viridis TaxID=58110 RepID=A0A931DMW7_9ACTN|nr:universal stress protein [Actinomadura viridis]MBG6090521.1 nucleotide-binding universal stress UspA family protein [Actinomadura viridis]